MSNQVRVLFFATLRDRAGIRETSLEVPPGMTVGELKILLLEKFPNLRQSMDTLIVAMNHEFAFDENIITSGAEVALFPPVSGGTHQPIPDHTIIEITEQEPEINTIIKCLSNVSTGAACVFTGVVRQETVRGKIKHTQFLEYEAYQEMAKEKMEQIAQEIQARWEAVDGIAMIQRIGKLLPGEISVVIVCTSSHRDEGIFDAARYGIERLKEIVPVWKKEVSREGRVWVEGDYIPQPGE